MSSAQTFIFRASPLGSKSVYRDIEIEPARSLYSLAESIVTAFDFDFDHAFGFYSGLTPAKLHREFPKYELFADMGDADPGVMGVRRTRIYQAFPAVGHTMMLLFDYGDDWLFRVALRSIGNKAARARYPRIVASRGEAPVQYPDPEEDDLDEGPRIGINLATGEIIRFDKT